MNIFRTLAILTLLVSSSSFSEETKKNAKVSTEETDSPWLITPLISSDPKLGTTFGAMAAYMHKFDEKSPISMFGMAANYSNTDSYTAALFTNSYFKEDSQRFLAAIVGGYVKNSYDYDELPQTVQSNDDIKMLFLRYSTRVYQELFVGLQYIDSNYIITGSDDFSNIILERANLSGFESNALGLVLTADSRDNQQSPSSGHNLILHNFAYRESFGGDVSFDAYMLEYSEYFAHGDNNVLALHIKGRWTSDAPNSGLSSMELRGYTRGQYLAQNSTFIELDDRFSLTERWGLTAFAGIGCLYGDKLANDQGESDEASCSASENIYPAAGVGASFMIKPEQKMVVRAEFAVGKDDNRGFYLKFGQPF